MTSTEIATRDQATELVSSLRHEQFMEQVTLALPENVTPERFVRIAITALQASPKIIECERASILRSLLASAAMGLMPDGHEAALVPFKGKAQLIPMIAGFRKIAADYGWTIRTAIVYANDEFEYELGLEPKFRHVPVRPGRERGEAIAAYAVGAHKDGRREVEVLNQDDVAKVRAISRSSDDGPWVDWYEQMAEKTAGRRLFKKLPLSDEDKRVTRVLAAIEPAEAAALIYGPNARELVNPETGEITSATSTDDGGRPAVSPEGRQVEEDAGDRQAESSSAPDDDDYVPEDEQQSFAGPAEAQELQARAAEAGKVVVPSNRPEFKGKTISEVAALGTEGEKYLRWILHPERGWAERDDRKAVLDATRVYCEIMLPDLWASTREAA